MTQVQLGAHNAMMELFMFMTSPVFGVIQAAVTRIGIHLGAGKPNVAVLAAQITACGIALLAAVNGIIIVSFRGQLGKIFSDDPNVVAIFSQICAFAALAYLILSFFYYAIVRSL